MASTRRKTAGSTGRGRSARATKAGAPVKAARVAKARPAAAKAVARTPRVSTHPPKTRTPATLALIDRLRAICLALPGATEQIAWGEPTWRTARGKMFAMCDTYHHGSAHLSVHLPAPPGAQAALIDADGARFFRPPYVGGKGWIGVVLDTAPDWAMVASLVETAHAVVGG